MVLFARVGSARALQNENTKRSTCGNIECAGGMDNTWRNLSLSLPVWTDARPVAKPVSACLFPPASLPAVYNFLQQQWIGYQTAVEAAGGASASASTGAVEAALMNRALVLLSKILPWAGEKSMGQESNDFLPVSAGRQRWLLLHGMAWHRVGLMWFPWTC